MKKKKEFIQTSFISSARDPAPLSLEMDPLLVDKWWPVTTGQFVAPRTASGGDDGPGDSLGDTVWAVDGVGEADIGVDAVDDERDLAVNEEGEEQTGDLATGVEGGVVDSMNAFSFPRAWSNFEESWLTALT